MSSLSNIIRKNLVNIPGWRTNRKIVVIESDDWGSIRMPSKEVYNILLSKGIPVDKSYFLKYDCLESEQDLVALFEVLSSFRDKNDYHPVITANTIVANPDFKKIETFGRKEYFYEPFTETYKQYPCHTKTIEIWKNEGMVKKMLWPQFHGREHINVRKWMNAINSNDPWERYGFENKTILGIEKQIVRRIDFNYMAAFEFASPSEWEGLSKIASEGLGLFRQIFGIESKSFIPPCSVKGDHLDPILKNEGVLFMQCGKYYIPGESRPHKIKNKLWGQQNKIGQIYWRRNATFEPSKNINTDCVDSCLAEMNLAFRWGKPVVINSHRVNFMGSINPKNRDKTLKLLKQLLTRTLKSWPQVEFISSDQLGDIILTTKNKNF